MHLNVLAKHFELLIAAFVLLRVHRRWYLVFVLRISTYEFELLVMSFVCHGLLASRGRNRRNIFLYDHIGRVLFRVESYHDY